MIYVYYEWPGSPPQVYRGDDKTIVRGADGVVVLEGAEKKLTWRQHDEWRQVEERKVLIPWPRVLTMKWYA